MHNVLIAMAFASGATVALAASRRPNRLAYATRYNSFWANRSISRHTDEPDENPESSQFWTYPGLPLRNSTRNDSFRKQIQIFCQTNWVSVALATLILALLGGLFLYHLLFGGLRSASVHPPIIMGALALFIVIPLILCRLLIRSHFRELDLQAQQRNNRFAVDNSTQTLQGHGSSSHCASRTANGRVYACIIIAPEERADPPSYDDAVRCTVPPNAVAPLTCNGCPFECIDCDSNIQGTTPPPSYGDALNLLGQSRSN